MRKEVERPWRGGWEDTLDEEGETDRSEALVGGAESRVEAERCKSEQSERTLARADASACPPLLEKRLSQRLRNGDLMVTLADTFSSSITISEPGLRSVASRGILLISVLFWPSHLYSSRTSPFLPVHSMEPWMMSL